MICYRAKHHKNQENHTDTLRRTQRGSVIVWILIAVVLFGALTFAFTQGMRGGESSVTKERANLEVTELLQYGNEVRDAFAELLINGCDESEISFDPLGVHHGDNSQIVFRYNNTNSPIDESCHVFSQNGGGLRWREFETATTKEDPILDGSYNYYGTRLRLTGSGSSEGEVQMNIHHVTEEVCRTLNQTILGTREYFTGAKFIGSHYQGSFQNDVHIGGLAGEEAYAGKQGGCYYHNWPGQETFIAYQVIRAR